MGAGGLPPGEREVRVGLVHGRRAQDLHLNIGSNRELKMLSLLRRLRTHLACHLVRRDVAAADKAHARGDVHQATRCLAKADLRLKKACGLTGWSVDPKA